MIGRVILLVLAAVAALVPWPAARVEQWYSRGLYARIQPIATSISNLVPVAIGDVAAVALLIAGTLVFVARVRARGARAAIGHAVWMILIASAVLYLVFLGAWGLNYRRLPLERKLDYDASRVTRDAALALGTLAVSHVNAGYAAAHATADDPASLARAFADAERALGATRLSVTGIPKHSVLSWYFRRAAIDGMTDPYFLEIIVNPDVLPFERPFVLAHEWGHLAGYADESEANFVAWLACIRGDALAQYSGWLAAYEQSLRALTREDRRLLPPLDPGPRDDRRAEAARYARSSPVVRTAASNLYDTYLKSNRVSEGIASYDAVIRLMLGTRFDPQWRPALRSE